jgi:nitrate reductase NapE component
MPEPFRLISEYFWIACLGVTWFNAERAKRRVTERGLPDDQMREAEVYIRRFALLASLPWIVVGVGQVAGSTPTIWYYFRPQDGNPFVLAWLVLVALLNGALSAWILLGGGARKIVQLGLADVFGRRRLKSPSVLVVKLYAVLSVAIIPAWIWGVLTMNPTIPS